MPEDAGTGQKAVYFSSKQAEEIGFDKFADRQARLHGIYVLVLDRMQIRHNSTDGVDIAQQESDIVASCSHITELDLSGNLFESVDEVFRLCALFPKLIRLVLDSNRFSALDYSPDHAPFSRVRTLSLSDTLLSWPEAAVLAQKFPALTDMTASRNELASLGLQIFPSGLKSMDISNNGFTSLDHLVGLSTLHNLHSIIIKHNPISLAISTEEATVEFPSIVEIDMAHSEVASWSFISQVTNVFPGMRHLRIAGAPLFQSLRSADDKPLKTEDGYMLTVARLPQLKTLNFSPITDKERLNSEIYYHSQIALELELAHASDVSSARDSAASKTTILARHPRWLALCEEYGDPVASARPDDATGATGTHNYNRNPNSLGARLVHLTFMLNTDSTPHKISSATDSTRTLSTDYVWIQELPRVYDIYSLLGNVVAHVSEEVFPSKKIIPLYIRLFWLSGEFRPKLHDEKNSNDSTKLAKEASDTVGSTHGHVLDAGMVDWWDSSEEDDSDMIADDHAGSILQEEVEVELLPGSRSIGSYIEGRRARIRVVVPPAAIVKGHG
jgi:hypothetical protein